MGERRRLLSASYRNSDTCQMPQPQLPKSSVKRAIATGFRVGRCCLYPKWGLLALNP